MTDRIDQAKASEGLNNPSKPPKTCPGTGETALPSFSQPASRQDGVTPSVNITSGLTASSHISDPPFYTFSPREGLVIITHVSIDKLLESTAKERFLSAYKEWKKAYGDDVTKNGKEWPTSSSCDGSYITASPSGFTGPTFRRRTNSLLSQASPRTSFPRLIGRLAGTGISGGSIPSNGNSISARLFPKNQPRPCIILFIDRPIPGRAIIAPITSFIKSLLGNEAGTLCDVGMRDTKKSKVEFQFPELLLSHCRAEAVQMITDTKINGYNINQGTSFRPLKIKTHYPQRITHKLLDYHALITLHPSYFNSMIWFQRRVVFSQSHQRYLAPFARLTSITYNISAIVKLHSL